MAELQHAAASQSVRWGTADAARGPARGELSTDQQVVLKYSRRDFDRVTKLPPELSARKPATAGKAFHAWASAKPSPTLAGYAPFIEHISSWQNRRPLIWAAPARLTTI